MRLDEIRVDPFGNNITATQFRKLMNRIKNNSLDTDRRSASIKNKIINQWKAGNRSISHFETDFNKLGLDIKSALGEMEE